MEVPHSRASTRVKSSIQFSKLKHHPVKVAAMQSHLYDTFSKVTEGMQSSIDAQKAAGMQKTKVI